jgi:cytochrome c
MMKKFLVLSCMAAAIYSCGGSEPKATATTTEPQAAATTAVADDLSKNPDYQKGLELIAKSDCLTCHKVDEASTGPSYRDVANKYENNAAVIDSLSQKIIKGGSGNWGTIPMTPHATLSADDAKQMVKYVMLLKTK